MIQNKIRLLLVNNNTETLSSLKKILEPFKEFKFLGEARNGVEAVDSALTYLPDVVIMDINMPVMDGFTAATKIARAAPYIGIILTGHAESLSIIRKAMQSGAGDFLELPFGSAELRHAIRSIYKTKQDQKKHLMEHPLVIPYRQPKVISVFSSKGGVGKTVLATNIAVSLRELTREDVLLMDMDLQFGDVADLLNLTPKTTVIDILADKEIEKNDLLKYLVSHYSVIKVLPAPQQPEQADLVGEKDLKDLVSTFATM